jgi:uncharacterized LabA/DUF88 family protein
MTLHPLLANAATSKAGAPHYTSTTLANGANLCFQRKKTDINMAAAMMTAAWTQACEQIVLCSNNSDMQAALSAIRSFRISVPFLLWNAQF